MKGWVALGSRAQEWESGRRIPAWTVDADPPCDSITEVKMAPKGQGKKRSALSDVVTVSTRGVQ